MGNYKRYDASKVQDDERKMHTSKKMRENDMVCSKCVQNAFKSKLSAQEQVVVNYIAENGIITSEQLMTLLDIRKRRAQIILGKLVDDGVLCKKGASRSTRYVFNDASSEN